MVANETKAERLRNLAKEGLVMRARDLREAGIGSATIAAAVDSGELERIS